jgi:hypothetical protein
MTNVVDINTKRRDRSLTYCLGVAMLDDAGLLDHVDAKAVRFCYRRGDIDDDRFMQRVDALIERYEPRTKP